MGVFAPNPVSILDPSKPSAPSTRADTTQLRAQYRGTSLEPVVNILARQSSSFQSQIDDILALLRGPLPTPTAYSIQDANGRLIATFGYRADGNAQNYGITIQDLSTNIAAWIGVQTENPVAIATTTNASPDVLGITAHGFVNGDTLWITGALGDTAINGIRIVKNKTANTFQLTDLSGTDINGNGAYTGGGMAQRYYGGGFFQTVGIGGTGFANAKIRAFANGDVEIRNAKITLISADGSIVLDPSTNPPTIIVTDTLNNVRTTISNGIVLDQPTSGTLRTLESPGNIQLESGGLPSVILDWLTGIDSTPGFSVGGFQIVDNIGRANFNRLQIASVTRIDTSGNLHSANGFNGSQTYVKSVNFGLSTVTTGTITVVDGIVTSMT